MKKLIALIVVIAMAVAASFNSGHVKELLTILAVLVAVLMIPVNREYIKR